VGGALFRAEMAGNGRLVLDIDVWTNFSELYSRVLFVVFAQRRMDWGVVCARSCVDVVVGFAICWMYVGLYMYLDVELVVVLEACF